MTRDEVLAALAAIVDGIDKCEVEDDSGWWETDTGAEFGARKLEELRQLVRGLV